MGAPGLTSPIRRETFKNLQLNAGIVLVNFEYDDLTDADAVKDAIADAIEDGKILGATRGGGSFTVTRDVREPEVDGKRYPFKGSKFVDSVDAYLATTLLEVVPETMKILLSSADVTDDGDTHTIKVRTAFEDTDYLTNLVWVGDLSDGRLVAIVLKNALNTADFSLTYTDKGEGTMAAEFHAHQDDVLDYDYAPFEIVFFDKAEDGTEGTNTETEGTNTETEGTNTETEGTNTETTP